MYPEAMRAAARVDNPQFGQRMLVLQVPHLMPCFGSTICVKVDFEIS